MTSLVYPNASSSHQKRHFSQRQRSFGSADNNLTLTEEIHYPVSDSWDKENNIMVEQKKEYPVKANLPSKHLSILLRQKNSQNKANENDIPKEETKNKLNSSDETGIIPTITSNSTSKGASASDKAILEGISRLNIEKIESPHPRMRISSMLHPPCKKCGVPVYPQEEVKPGSHLIFHISCFKCYKCGIQLTLGSFYKGSDDAKLDRIYCRSHLHLSPEVRSVSSYPSIDDRTEIVKSDSIGLRYF